MTRILAVDAGNTRVKCAVIEDGTVLEQWSFPTRYARSKMPGALKRFDLPVALSSVVPAATEATTAWCRANGRELFVVANVSQKLISSKEELGGDLLSATAAALKLYGKGRPVAVLGLGTAITMTATRGDGTFVGAWFTLGLRATLETLAKRCALLGVAKLARPESIALGTDTPSCMTNGVLLDVVGTARAYAEEARRALGDKALVIATGGDSTVVVPLANQGRRRKLIDVVDSELTLKGIYLLYADSKR